MLGSCSISCLAKDASARVLRNLVALPPNWPRDSGQSLVGKLSEGHTTFRVTTPDLVDVQFKLETLDSPLR